MAGNLDRQCSSHGSTRLESSLDHSLGSSHQRIARLSRVLCQDERGSARNRSHSANRGRPVFLRFGISRGRLHYERLRIPIASSESSELLEHGILRPHLPDQNERLRRATRGAYSSPCESAQHDRKQPAIRRRLGLVRLRLRHTRGVRVRRSHLLSRGQRHLSPAQACSFLLSIAMRSFGGNRIGTGLSMVSRGRLEPGDGDCNRLFQLRPSQVLRRRQAGFRSGSRSRYLR